MGRPRKSPKLRVLEGDKPHRARQDAPASPMGLGEPPDYLDAHGREAWSWLKARLDEMGIGTRADEATAALFCVQYALNRKALEVLESEGMTVSDTVDRTVENQRGIRSTTTTTTKLHPMYRVESDTAAKMARLLSQMGMNPAARQGMHVKPKEEGGALIKFLEARASGGKK